MMGCVTQETQWVSNVHWERVQGAGGALQPLATAGSGDTGQQLCPMSVPCPVSAMGLSPAWPRSPVWEPGLSVDCSSSVSARDGGEASHIPHAAPGRASAYGSFCCHNVLECLVLPCLCFLGCPGGNIPILAVSVTLPCETQLGCGRETASP